MKASALIGLYNYHTLTEPCIFRIEAVMGLLDFSFRSTFLHDCFALGSFLYRYIVNGFMDRFEKFALDLSHQKPFLWLRHINNQTLLLANFDSIHRDTIS